MSEPEPSRPGSILRAEREALGVTVREVSETLNLSIAVIEAIEADDHERLPGPVFARGYVRAYARLLELEPEPLVAQYPSPPESLSAVRGSSESPVWEWIRRRPELVLGAGAALLALLLVLLVVWLWPGEGVPDAADDPTPEPADEPVDPGSFPWRPAPGDSGSTVPPADGLLNTPGLAADVSPLGLADPGEPAVEAAPAEDGADSVRRITATGDDRLELAFTEDCWIEVKNGAGANLYSNLSRRGSRLTLVGQGPFRILLGYAPGAELAFNGEPVPLGPHTRNNVATLVLGQ